LPSCFFLRLIIGKGFFALLLLAKESFGTFFEFFFRWGHNEKRLSVRRSSDAEDQPTTAAVTGVGKGITRARFFVQLDGSFML